MFSSELRSDNDPRDMAVDLKPILIVNEVRQSMWSVCYGQIDWIWIKFRQSFFVYYRYSLNTEVRRLNFCVTVKPIDFLGVVIIQRIREIALRAHFKGCKYMYHIT